MKKDSRFLKKSLIINLKYWHIDIIYSINIKPGGRTVLQKLRKRNQKLFSQPNDIDYKELQYVLLRIGCDERQGGKGSHVIFTHRETGVSITVPIRRPLKKILCYASN